MSAHAIMGKSSPYAVGRDCWSWKLGWYREPIRRNKFGVRLDPAGRVARTYKGVLYHSHAEASYARELDLRLRAGDIRGWRRQIRVPLIVNGKKMGDYIADFEVVHHNGRMEYVEVKGTWTKEARLKWKLFRALYPDAWCTVVES